MLLRVVSHASFLEMTGFEVYLVINRTIQDYDEQNDDGDEDEEVELEEIECENDEGPQIEDVEEGSEEDDEDFGVGHV